MVNNYELVKILTTKEYQSIININNANLIINVFIPHKRDKLGKLFCFVRFKGVRVKLLVRHI